MDAEQIKREMSHTRAAIDRKLDILAERTTAAKQQSMRALAGLAVALSALFVVWRWRRARA